MVDRGIGAGATAAGPSGCSSDVQVRLGEIDSLSRSEGEEVGLRLFVGQRSATVASSDFSDDVLGVLVERCLAMAREAPEDAFAGLAPTELIQKGEAPDLDCNDSREPDPADLRARALEVEPVAHASAQFERCRCKRHCIDNRPCDLGRIYGCLSCKRACLLSRRDRRRRGNHAARPCVAQRPPPRRSRKG
jgi:hypothetical protein